MNIAYFGGTFNPPHRGHEQLIREVLKLELFDLVAAVPVNIPPHKEAGEDTEAQDRLQMARLAFGPISGCTVDETEILRGGVSYTIDTVNDFSRRYSVEGKIGVVIGYDLVEGLRTWKSWDKLKSRVHFLIARRGREETDLSPLEGCEYTLLDNPLIHISSEEIRRKASRGEDITGFVSEPVAGYIARRGLYGSKADNSSGS